MNMVALSGYLASDVDLRETNTGDHVASFRIEIIRPNKPKSEYFDVTVWGYQAEQIAGLKEAFIEVEGQLHQSVWENAEGKRQSKVEVIAHRVTTTALHDEAVAG